MSVLLLDRYGNPLLVWHEDVSYRRNNAGFCSPAAREKEDELLGRDRDERSPVLAEAEAEEEGGSGEGLTASEDDEEC